MKTLFIETKYEGEIKLPESLIRELPEKIMLATTVQFIDFISGIKNQLEIYNKKISLFKGIHGRYPGQILGCDNFKIRQDVDAFLYIGDGEFHPKALLVNEKPVFVYNPLSKEGKRLGRAERGEIEIRKKVGLGYFYKADKIGILVSVKPGQYNLKRALELKGKLEEKGKEVYVFLGDVLRNEYLEDFNFIDCWVNTACPRLRDDFERMVNLGEI